jgi:hypothetical protein
MFVQLTHRRGRRGRRGTTTHPDLAVRAFKMLVYGARTETEQLADSDG